LPEAVRHLTLTTRSTTMPQYLTSVWHDTDDDVDFTSFDAQR
jgi:hypothetical protein